jgi:hypothetical protein
VGEGLGGPAEQAAKRQTAMRAVSRCMS